MEIGSAALTILVECWDGHLTPPEVASLADRASRARDSNMVRAAAELALSCLPHAHALNPNEIQRALVQCKEQVFVRGWAWENLKIQFFHFFFLRQGFTKLSRLSCLSFLGGTTGMHYCTQFEGSALDVHFQFTKYLICLFVVTFYKLSICCLKCLGPDKLQILDF
jgi:hypothetical protein